MQQYLKVSCTIPEFSKNLYKFCSKNVSHILTHFLVIFWSYFSFSIKFHFKTKQTLRADSPPPSTSQKRSFPKHYTKPIIEIIPTSILHRPCIAKDLSANVIFLLRCSCLNPYPSNWFLSYLQPVEKELHEDDEVHEQRLVAVTIVECKARYPSNASTSPEHLLQHQNSLCIQNAQCWPSDWVHIQGLESKLSTAKHKLHHHFASYRYFQALTWMSYYIKTELEKKEILCFRSRQSTWFLHFALRLVRVT